MSYEQSKALDDLISGQVARMKSLGEPLTALGLGGSRGRGDDDASSDIDFFVFFDSGDAFLHAAWLRSNLTQPAGVISEGQVKFFAGYGVCLSFVVDRDIKLEYFVNTPSTWSENSMRQFTRVCFDASGEFTRLLTNSSADLRQRDLKQIQHDLIIEALNLRKLARRGDLWSMQYRIAIIQRLVVSISLSDQPDVPLSPQVSMRHWERLDPATQAALSRTAVPTDRGALADAVHSISVAVESTKSPRIEEICDQLDLICAILLEAASALIERPENAH